MASRVAGSRHGVLSGIEVRIVFHPSLHLLAFVGDYLPTRGFERGRIRLALYRTQCIPLMFPVIAAVCIMAELCTILVRTSPRGLLNFAPGSSENLQVPFAG